MEGGGEVHGGVIQRLAMQRGPEVEYIALGSAVCLEALENILAEVDGERVLAIRGVTVNRTRAPPLLAAAVQRIEQAEVAQHLFEGDLAAQERVVHARACGSRCGRGRIDRSGGRRYAGSGRGDHLLGGNFPFVARGLCVAGRQGDDRLRRSRC
jgi:hypothetical protein